MTRFMPHAAGAVLLVTFATQCAFAADVYIVAGQSNGWRISHLRERPGATDEHAVHYFGMKCVSEPVAPDVAETLVALDPNTMGYGLANAVRDLSDDDIIFVQYCRCGAGVWNQAVNGWYPGDDPKAGQVFNDGLYGSFLKYIAECRRIAEERGLTWNVRGLFWHQGENDSNRQAQGYEENLTNLFWRFRHDLGDADLPIIAGHIRELDAGDLAVNAVLDRVAERDPWMAVVPTRDLPFAPDRDSVPDVHISLPGCHELGRRMAAALAQLTQSNATGDSASIRFRDVTDEAGLREPLLGLMGHGGAWGDVDGDGDLDLFVGGFADRPDEEYAPADGPVGSQLLINENGVFHGVDSAANHVARTSGAVFVDLDNNGTLELYVANNAKPGGRPNNRGPLQAAAQRQQSLLFRNDAGQLVDITADSGACPSALYTARNIGVFDYDADGLLDLLLIEDRFRKDPQSVLLHNEGSLLFRSATAEAGLPSDLFGLGHAVADLNDDGRPDFFVGHSNRLFLSRGDGTYFEPESLRETFAWEPLHGEDWPCGAAFGDLNGNGRLDMVLSIHCETARNRVYLNEGLTNGVPVFRDVTAEAGFPDVVPTKCPHVEIQDFDNDGRPDVYLSAGWLDDSGTFTPLILRNTGDVNGVPQFDVPGDLSQTMVYYPAGPSADYDGDGRVDLFLINWFRGNHCRLLKNESPTRHWLDVSVTGSSFNRMGIGSRIRVLKTGTQELLGVQEVQIGYGYASGQPAVCHFGLGDMERVDLEIRLPDGTTLTRSDVATNQALVVDGH